MKILLAAVNAKYIHSNPAVHLLARYAADEVADVKTEIAEYTINQPIQEILADLYGRDADVMAFSVYIWNAETVRNLVSLLGKVRPGLPLWLGGPEASYHTKQWMEMSAVTGIMIGEGEKTFADLCRHYRTKSPKFEEIPGLCFRQEQEDGSKIIQYTGAREPMNMDEVPFVYDRVDEYTNRIIYYESQRGCPFSCSYCLSSIDRTLRLRSLDKVLPELQHFLDCKVPQVKFVDRTFNCSRPHALAIWRYLAEHDNGVTNFHFEISADLLGDDELQVLSGMRPGLVQFEIGVQSTNPETIREIRRSMDLERLERVTATIRSFRNIHQHLDLIAGLPYEDMESFRNSFNRVFAMKPDQLQLGFLKVLAGSYMAEKASDYEIAFTDCPPYEVLSTRWLSFGDICRLKQVEQMVELYYNSGQFTHVLPVLLQAFDTPFDLFEKLAEDSVSRGFDRLTPARADRYRNLHAFALANDPANGELYRELLTFDLYLRENAKSRPEFAADLGGYREELYAREISRKDHLDVFFYPVWLAGEPGGLLNKADSPTYVRFCYDRRDPLTHNAFWEFAERREGERT